MKQIPQSKEQIKNSTCIVTGGAGFIGSNFIHHLLKTYDDIYIVNVDKLTYAWNLDNLKDVEQDSRYHFVKVDICDKQAIEQTIQEFGINEIVNFAADFESGIIWNDKEINTKWPIMKATVSQKDRNLLTLKESN